MHAKHLTLCMGHAAGRLAMDHYSRLRAKEEISRLNIEIGVLSTYVRTRPLSQHGNSVQEFNPQLAHQVALHGWNMVDQCSPPSSPHQFLTVGLLETSYLERASTSDWHPALATPHIQPPVIVHSDDVEEGVIDVEETLWGPLRRIRVRMTLLRRFHRTFYHLFTHLSVKCTGLIRVNKGQSRRCPPADIRRIVYITEVVRSADCKLKY